MGKGVKNHSKKGKKGNHKTSSSANKKNNYH